MVPVVPMFGHHFTLKNYPHLVCEGYMNFILTMYLYLCGIRHICVYYLYNMTCWGVHKCWINNVTVYITEVYSN